MNNIGNYGSLIHGNDSVIKCTTCNIPMVLSDKRLYCRDDDELIREFHFTCPLCERLDVIEK